MTEYPIQLNRMALVNVDMQVAFVEGTPLSAPRGRDLVDVLNPLIKVCRQAGLMVIHTRHVTRQDGSNLGSMGDLIDAVRDGYIMEGSSTVELHPDVDVQSTDIILDKPRYGAFTGTDLDNILRGNGIDSIIISGICTNICCETTAREAGMRDYRVFFMEDGTETFPIGDLTSDQIRRVVNATVGVAFANVLPVSEMINRLNRENISGLPNFLRVSV